MDRKDIHLSFEAENLAVPEVHTGKVKEKEEHEEKKHHLEIKFDNVAIPEVRVRQ